MSGIIGGAGSKSGVIGTTELDYEEGEWLPTGTNVNTSAVYGTYTKIGRIVKCFGQFSTSGATGAIAFGGLPFTVFNATIPGGGITCYQGWGIAGVIPVANTQTFQFIEDYTVVGWGSGNEIRFFLSYRVS